jgi:hypothetical protein
MEVENQEKETKETKERLNEETKNKERIKCYIMKSL